MEDIIKSLHKSIRKAPDSILLEEKNAMNIKMYAQFLIQNLSVNFNNLIYNNDLGNNLNFIANIRLPFANNYIHFTIALYPSYNNQWTVACPEIIGCVSQGNSKKDALENLCYAISQCLILNIEILKFQPFSSRIKLLKGPFLTKLTIYQPSLYINFLYLEFKMNSIYLGERHIILKKDSDPLLNLTVPISEINSFTFQVMTRTLREEYFHK
jgi:predicted RNase H-like HicB family nuclease